MGKFDPTRYWADIYQQHPTTDVSWFQAKPTLSLELLGRASVRRDDAVLDVGAGASVLVDRLLDLGYQDLSLLDIAERALETTRRRLGNATERVHWIVADLLRWKPDRRYDLWHDRAVFHFLTDPEERGRYLDVLGDALAPGGHAVIATFAEDGPERCSGLPVGRYDAASLAAQFPGLVALLSRREEHVTPTGAIQPFTWLLLESR